MNRRNEKTLCQDGSIRDRIVNAAFDAFMERGYAKTSTLDIATRARVSKRELYSHFKDKEDLFAAGILGRSRAMRVPLDLPEATSLEGLAATLKSLGVSMLSVLTDDHVLATYRLAIAELPRSPEVAATLDRAGREEMRRALMAYFKAAQQRGLIGRGNPDDMTFAFCSLLLSDLILRLVMGVAKKPSAKEIARRAARASEIFLELHALESAHARRA